MRLAAALAAAVVTVAGCTSTTSGAPSRSSSAAPAPASSSVAAPVSAAAARAALLRTSDLGPGFVRQPFPGGGSDTTNPCLPAGSPSLDRKYPPGARAQTGFRVGAPQALLGEQVSLYRDSGTARAVIAYAQRALSCASATVQGQKVQIRASAPARQVGGESVDFAQSWALAIGPAAASIVAVRLGNAVISMEFVALSSTDVSKLPPETQLVAAAIRRAKSALS